MTANPLDQLAERLRSWEDRWAERNRDRLRSGNIEQKKAGHLGGGGVLVWLVTLVVPGVEAAQGRYGSVGWSLGGLLLFTAVFGSLMLLRDRGRNRLLRYVLLVACVTLGLALAGRYQDNGYVMVVFPSMATTMVLPIVRPAFLGLITFTGLAMGLGYLTGGSMVGMGYAAFTAGFVVFIMRRLFATIELLREARGDLAKAAVAEERLRFARDLHDLLGHSLSLIVVKAEVVRRLVPHDAAAAATAAGDIEQVGRKALVEVREAVTGYRQRDLSGELAGARATLQAGGIDTVVDATAGQLGDRADALLGWAVREGSTNVLRHSGARRCTITLRRNMGRVVLTVTDDGAGPVPGGVGPDRTGNGISVPIGNGLRGLIERFDVAGGTVTAAHTPTGFVLTATVPDEQADGDQPSRHPYGQADGDQSTGGPDERPDQGQCAGDPGTAGRGPGDDARRVGDAARTGG